MNGLIDFAALRPWWLRAAILILLAIPLVTGGTLHTGLHPEHPWNDIGGWLGYGAFIWLFIGMCVGIDRVLVWLAAGTVFGLTLILGGAAVAKLGVWEFLHSTLGLPNPTFGAPGALDLDYVFRLLIVMISLPYFVFALQSFPAADVFSAAVRKGTKQRVVPIVVFAVFLRLFQHVFEVLTRLLVAWQEENPDRLLPRHRTDIQSSFKGRFLLIDWFKDAARVWSQALLAHSLIFVPVAIRDWELYIAQAKRED